MIALVANARDRSDTLFHTTLSTISEPEGLLFNRLNAHQAMEIADGGIGVKTVVNKKCLGVFHVLCK